MMPNLETTKEERSERLAVMKNVARLASCEVEALGLGFEAALCRDVDTLKAALEALSTAAWAYEAVQDGATHPSRGMVQPITVAEGKALQAALAKADELLRDPQAASAQAQGYSRS